MRKIGRPRFEIDYDKVKNLYEEGLACTIIAERFGVSRFTIYKILHRKNAKIRSRKLIHAPAQKIAYEYLYNKKNQTQLAREYHVSRKTIKNRLNAQGVKTRDLRNDK